MVNIKKKNQKIIIGVMLIVVALLVFGKKIAEIMVKKDEKKGQTAEEKVAENNAKVSGVTREKITSVNITKGLDARLAELAAVPKNLGKIPTFTIAQKMPAIVNKYPSLGILSSSYGVDAQINRKYENANKVPAPAPYDWGKVNSLLTPKFL